MSKRDKSKTTQHDPSTILDDGLSALKREMSRIKAQSQTEEGLDAKDGKLLTEYLKVAVIVDKNSRQVDIESSLGQYTDQEINDLLKQAITKLTDDGGNDD